MRTTSYDFLFPFRFEGGGYYVDGVYHSEEGSSCKCGHFIKNMYRIVHYNDAEPPFYVGSTCVKKAYYLEANNGNIVQDNYGEKLIEKYWIGQEVKANFEFLTVYSQVKTWVRNKTIWGLDKETWRMMMHTDKLGYWMLNTRLKNPEKIVLDMNLQRDTLMQYAKKCNIFMTIPKETDFL